MRQEQSIGALIVCIVIGIVAAAVMLVPRQFTFDCESAILELLGPKDACRVQVLSLHRKKQE